MNYNIARFFCALTGHTYKRIRVSDWMHDFVDFGTGKTVSHWMCSCGVVFMSDGRWSRFRIYT